MFVHSVTSSGKTQMNFLANPIYMCVCVCVCVYIFTIAFAIQQKLAWHCKSTTILKNNPTVYLKQVCLLYISYTSVTPFGKKIQHLYVEVCCHFLLL